MNGRLMKLMSSLDKLRGPKVQQTTGGHGGMEANEKWKLFC